jgi:hypothetical protein
MPTESFFGIELSGPSGGYPAKDDLIELFELVRPRPTSHRLIRLGGSGDGAYLVPDDLDGVTHCISPGVARRKHFEDEIAVAYGISSTMLDFSVDLEDVTTPLIEGKQEFHKLWLDLPSVPDSIDLATLIERAPTGDLLLQMDIEGAEYRNIMATSEQDLSRFRVMLFELHGLQRVGDARVLREVLLPFFRKLAQTHQVVHVHPNNYVGPQATLPGTEILIPPVIELTALRRDRITDDDVVALELPHRLDVKWNSVRQPPMFLGPEWGGDTVDTRARRLEIYAEWTAMQVLRLSNSRSLLAQARSASSATVFAELNSLGAPHDTSVSATARKALSAPRRLGQNLERRLRRILR